MSGHVDVLPTLADLCGLDVPAGVRAKLEGGSLRPALEDAGASLDPDRMQVHHVGRWSDPGSWRDHRYANSCVRWRSYTLVRIDPCGDDRCGTCFAVRNRVPRGTHRLSYTNNPDHHAVPAPGRWSLYDLAVDPFQSRDIAAEQPEIARRMAARYEAWWRKVEAALGERWKE
jgi:arylsulfatase A-like enzyme